MEPERRSWPRIIAIVAGWAVAVPVVLLLGTFAVLFLWHSSVPWTWGRGALAALFVLATLGMFVAFKPRWKALVGFAALFAVVALWFHFLPARNDRDWRPEVDRVASAEFDGDLVTLRNVRNFSYRTEDDFDAAWETRPFDLSKLRTLDMSFTYWGPQDIAHTMMSFGFEDGRYLCVSVEARKEMGEVYAPIASLFKKFEVMYILGDERDLVGVRTNHRGEHTYVFPSPLPPEKVRILLEDVLARVNDLAATPSYYRTLKGNCTTSLVEHLNKVRDEPIPFSLDLLLNGHIPEMAYRRGQFGDTGAPPFEEVKEHYSVVERAKAGGTGPGFSQRIREGLGPTLRPPDEAPAASRPQ